MAKKDKLTVDDFLQFQPKRLDFEWDTKTKGLVEIKVPKFKNNFGKFLCKLIKKEETFTVNLDKIGSLVWISLDGKNTIKQILEILKKQFPNEEKLEDRLFSFIQQMKSLQYITF